MRKSAIILICLWSAVTFAQNARVDGVIESRTGSPAAAALVSACTQPATILAFPPYCSPLAPLCASVTDATCNASTFPIQGDGLGNYHYYISKSAGPYTVCFYGGSLAVPVLGAGCLPDQSPPGGTSGNGTFPGNNTFTGTNTFTANTTLSSIDTVRFVDGVTYTTVQAAINSLPGSGGSVRIPCGTYVGPTTIPSNTSLVSMCERPSSLSYATLWGTNPGGVFSALGGTVLTYTTNLNLTQVQNIVISDVILDFASGGFGVNLASVSLVRMTNVLIDRCGSTTQPCLNMTTTGALATNNNLLNMFDHLKINAATPSGVATGVVLNGNIGNSNFVTNNTFIDLKVGGALGVGVDFQTNCDTNWFFGLQINSSAAGAMGVQFNNASPGSDHDANSNHVFGYSCAAGCASPFLRFGQSSGNYVTGMGNGVAPTIAGGNPAFLVFWSGATGGSVPSTYTNAHNLLDLTTISQANLTGPLLFQEGAAGSAASGQDACQGNTSTHALQCSYNNGTFFNMAQTISTGSATMTTALIGSLACGTTVTVSAPGVATTDAIAWAFNAAPAANPGELVVSAWPTSANVNFQYCNPTAGGVTPNAATLNWRVVR